MISLSSQTAAAIALHGAQSSWVVFLQAPPPVNLIHFEAIHGRDLANRLVQLSRDNATEIQLVGLIESASPEDDVYALANEFAAYQTHDLWFTPSGELLALIASEGQDAVSLLLAQTHPGGLSDAPVDIEEIARIIGVSVPTVRRMVKANQIPFLKFGRNYRFVPNDVIASIRSA